MSRFLPALMGFAQTGSSLARLWGAQNEIANARGKLGGMLRRLLRDHNGVDIANTERALEQGAQALIQAGEEVARCKASEKAALDIKEALESAPPPAEDAEAVS